MKYPRIYCIAGALSIFLVLALIFMLLSSPPASGWKVMLGGLLLAIALIIWSKRPERSPKFFIFDGESGGCVFLNKYVLDQLTQADVAHLSSDEQEFFEMYCNGWRIVHIKLKGEMSQEDLCRYLVKNLSDVSSREPIDIAKLLATEPGSSSIG